MGFCRAPLFRKRQFAAEIIVTCVRWYLRFSLSLRDVEELMAERGLSVDHTTIWRWTRTYAPEAQRRLQGQLKPKGSTWRTDVIGSHLKQSGMFWTLRGANAIIALRCCHLNGRFEDYWDARRAA